MPFAEIAVNAAAPIRQTFTYRVPDGVHVEPGQAVYVPFGARSLQGIIAGLSEHSEFEQTREITDVIDPRPLLSPEHIALARWLSEYYLAPFFDCVSLMLPPGFRRKPLDHAAPAGLARRAVDPPAHRPPGGRPPPRHRAGRGRGGRAQARGEAHAALRARSPRSSGAASSSASYRLARPQIAPKVVRQLRLDAPEPEARARDRGAAAGRLAARAATGPALANARR